jgi:hypothetical protein
MVSLLLRKELYRSAAKEVKRFLTRRGKAAAAGATLDGEGLVG